MIKAGASYWRLHRHSQETVQAVCHWHKVNRCGSDPTLFSGLPWIVSLKYLCYLKEALRWANEVVLSSCNFVHSFFFLSSSGCVNVCQWCSQARERIFCVGERVEQDWEGHGSSSSRRQPSLVPSCTYLSPLPTLALIGEPARDFRSCASSSLLTWFCVQLMWASVHSGFDPLPYSEPSFRIFILCPVLLWTLLFR